MRVSRADVERAEGPALRLAFFLAQITTELLRPRTCLTVCAAWAGRASHFRSSASVWAASTEAKQKRLRAVDRRGRAINPTAHRTTQAASQSTKPMRLVSAPTRIPMAAQLAKHAPSRSRTGRRTAWRHQPEIAKSSSKHRADGSSMNGGRPTRTTASVSTTVLALFVWATLLSTKATWAGLPSRTGSRPRTRTHVGPGRNAWPHESGHRSPLLLTSQRFGSPDRGPISQKLRLLGVGFSCQAGRLDTLNHRDWPPPQAGRVAPVEPRGSWSSGRSAGLIRLQQVVRLQERRSDLGG